MSAARTGIETVTYVTLPHLLTYLNIIKELQGVVGPWVGRSIKAV